MHDNREKRVSILMPCFNAAHTLDETIRSILAQTYSCWELIVVDDGSGDDTFELLSDWGRVDNRIKVLSIPHGGIIKALNHGLENCTGEYIARMDADDLMHAERIEQQVRYLQDNETTGLVSCLVDGFPVESVRAGFRVYLDWLNALVAADDIARELFVESPLPHPSVMIRKQVFEKVGCYEEHGWAEDYDLWLRMFVAGVRFGKVPQTLVYWREHENRLTRTDGRYSVENFLRAKAHYLAASVLREADAVVVWGAGQMGRRISKYLLQAGQPLKCFIDVDEKKIGRTKRGLPIYSREQLPDLLQTYERPVVLAAVGSHRARGLIRQWMNSHGYIETRDWWAVA